MGNLPDSFLPSDEVPNSVNFYGNSIVLKAKTETL